MTLKSRFDKGNIVIAYDVVARSERTLMVVNIKSWDLFKGFCYAFRDLDAKTLVFEDYDDLDFETQFDVKQVFGDVFDYRRYNNKEKSWKKNSLKV